MVVIGLACLCLGKSRMDWSMVAILFIYAVLRDRYLDYGER